jgi:phosphoserine phosphatase
MCRTWLCFTYDGTKPSVQAQAVHKINHGDLTGLLFAQGYKRSEFLGS